MSLILVFWVGCVPENFIKVVCVTLSLRKGPETLQVEGFEAGCAAVGSEPPLWLVKENTLLIPRGTQAMPTFLERVGRFQ